MSAGYTPISCNSHAFMAASSRRPRLRSRHNRIVVRIDRRMARMEFRKGHPRRGWSFASTPLKGSACALALFRKLAQRLFGQDGVAIFPDFLDLAVLEPPHHAIVVVVAHAFPRDVVALA